jgi:hypothetical protein
MASIRIKMMMPPIRVNPRARASFTTPDGSMIDTQRRALRDYAARLASTRETMRRADIGDYAELIIALAQNDFDFPKPADTPQRRTHLERATAILRPLLRHPG